jgi:glycosyltransferase involved in cell wall biosynthesis
VKTASSATPQKWCIITCEYPPLLGGVSDHTFLLATAFAEAGDTVDIWTPPGGSPPPSSAGVSVHLLPSLFHFDSLRILRRVIREQSPETRVLIQYVPTSFGWRMMNLPFALMLFAERAHPIDVYFHEVGFQISWTQRLRRSFAALVHVAMNWFAVRAATRVFVAIPEWSRRLDQLGATRGSHKPAVVWVPVPSNVPAHADPDRVAAVRAAAASRGATTLVGHFGTFGRYYQARLIPALAQVLDADVSREVLLIGRNSVAFRDRMIEKHPEHATRIVATGGLEPRQVSVHIAACDVLIQPYEDGVSARRGSLMAGLALGSAIVSNRGGVTGPVWSERAAVLLTNSDRPGDLAGGVTALLQDAQTRNALGARARAMHDELFALGRGVATLRDAVHFAPRDQQRRVRSLRNPRIMMLHTTLPTPGRKPGGVEIAVHRLANALVSIGIDVTVCSLSDSPPDATYDYRPLFTQLPWLRDSRFGRLLILPLLLNFVSPREADVVHYHGDDWFVVRRPRATVRTLHGSALREAERSTRWQRRVVQRAIYPLERMARRLATLCVAVGRDTADIHGLRRVIGNGVDPRVFTPGPKASVPTLLYLGTWAGRKRGAWMYERFVNEIATRHPAVQLHFIADVEPPAHPRVNYERFPGDEDLARAYREAWIFALPSTYEGFGIPYLEAMASGTPVVATPNTGARELLGDDEFGRLADDDRFADTVLELLNDHAQRERLAKAGIRRSRDYLWPNIARSYLDVYAEALLLHHDAVSAD